MLVLKGRPDVKIYVFTFLLCGVKQFYSYPQISAVLLKAKWADHHENNICRNERTRLCESLSVTVRKGVQWKMRTFTCL